MKPAPLEETVRKEGISISPVTAIMIGDAIAFGLGTLVTIDGASHMPPIGGIGHAANISQPYIVSVIAAIETGYGLGIYAMGLGLVVKAIHAAWVGMNAIEKQRGYQENSGEMKR